MMSVKFALECIQVICELTSKRRESERRKQMRRREEKKSDGKTREIKVRNTLTPVQTSHS